MTRASSPPRRSSIPPRATIPPLAVAAAVVASAASAGCANFPLLHRGAKVVVRPAANVDGEEPKPPRFFSPPIALAGPEDAIVRVMGPQLTCSGTLVDEDLVLTAHHCVVELVKPGEFSTRLVDAKELHIDLGGDYLPWGSVGVKTVIAPPCGEAGGAGDVAVLVLERKIVGLGTMKPRLDAAPTKGEPVDPVGFGRCAMSADGIHRSTRPGGPITSVAAGTMMLTASICPGDSGGPVVARGSREVVGVISESAMDGDARTSSPSVVARIDAFRSVFAVARLVADGISASELPPLSCDK